jgi:hypothetical protein
LQQQQFLGLNKAGVALLMAAALWSIRADASPAVGAAAGGGGCSVATMNADDFALSSNSAMA